ncbi:MAG: hypothetical protein HY747_12310 [Elusimicrobia bacterium]|nr:hypothetical protein [Elusimicrobiota bacterium]
MKSKYAIAMTTMLLMGGSASVKADDAMVVTAGEAQTNLTLDEVRSLLKQMSNSLVNSRGTLRCLRVEDGQSVAANRRLFTGSPSNPNPLLTEYADHLKAKCGPVIESVEPESFVSEGDPVGLTALNEFFMATHLPCAHVKSLLIKMSKRRCAIPVSKWDAFIQAHDELFGPLAGQAQESEEETGD